MKRVSIPLAISLAATLLAILASGCKEDTKPRITRIYLTPACGVAPVEVMAAAYASGGDESGDPLGGNNNLEMNWQFGDGATGATSVAYHTYDAAGTYNVVVTATDPAGETASAAVPMLVLADSLVVDVTTNYPGGAATTNDIVRFDLSAISCDLDFPAVPGDSVKVALRWEMNDSEQHVYTGTSPDFRFTEPGTYNVELTATYPSWAVTRHFEIPLTISAADGAR
jgi:hypothetical protein